MCGINIIIGLQDALLAKNTLAKMNAAMAHRGPDNDGIFVDGPVALGHRRLSIIDLSAAGNQPMSGCNGRYQIVYNGEFYNYKEVKTKLLAVENPYSFQFGSDTEVILAAYHTWGVNCLQHINGMFAFAIYDAVKKEMFIARDRMGIKPLYYYQNEGCLVLSSEIRSLLASELIPRKLNKNGLIDYLRYQTVHAPETMVAGIKMLMPGKYCLFNINHNPRIEEKKYWSIKEISKLSTKNYSYKQVCERVYELLYASVQRRLIADVPFGAFLSGGIDSSAIVGLMSKAASQTVKTFSVTFDESEFSEARYARLIAEKFKTNHHEIKLTSDYFMQELPAALKAMDYPSGDGPNTYVVSKVTKNAGITMALSGLGGDELFAGYPIFTRSQTLQKFEGLAMVPSSLRKIPAALFKFIRPGIPSEKIAELLSLNNLNFENTYPLSRQIIADAQLKKLTGFAQLAPNSVARIIHEHELNKFETLTKVSIAEIASYMQNVLLRDTDQMSMASALEVRVPFLDYTLVEFVLSLPDAYKNPTSPKKLLIDALGNLLPPEIINRPKMGFTLPWKHWMKHEMREFCEQKISSLSKRSFIVEAEIKTLWNAFLSDSPLVPWSRLWYLIVLENWLIENNISSE
ncbi:MAG TPA: asparagine synthase (glutamine-hydrolyzing) [Bacteroidia bacterium]|nr:asparagine synthase (glutamine-hydrolyzing) [Bacteroidia bacterium]HRH09409.1 asparagine synthase (glutamine-hydrolyzing) [Bacteroidia bacterium]